jgi:hypothetical protein
MKCAPPVTTSKRQNWMGVSTDIVETKPLKPLYLLGLDSYDSYYGYYIYDNIWVHTFITSIFGKYTLLQEPRTLTRTYLRTWSRCND